MEDGAGGKLRGRRSCRFVPAGPPGPGQSVRFTSPCSSRSGPTGSGGANPNVLQSRLSAAEARIFVLLLGGLSEKEIAARQKISRHTVHNHVKRIYSAYGVHSRAELLSKALSERRED